MISPFCFLYHRGTMAGHRKKRNRGRKPLAGSRPPAAGGRKPTDQGTTASLLFILGNLGFAGANVFYDALLPHVAKPEDQDTVSTRGYAMGYLGGGVECGMMNAAIHQLAAHVKGQVSNVMPGRGVVIAAAGSLVQGTWGSGGEAEGVLKVLVDNYNIMPISTPEHYKYYVPMRAVFFLSVYDDWGRQKKRYFESLKLNVHVIRDVNPEEKGISGTEVRRRMAEGLPWEHLVPGSVASLLYQWEIPQRLSSLKL